MDYGINMGYSKVKGLLMWYKSKRQIDLILLLCSRDNGEDQYLTPFEVQILDQHRN